MASTLNKTGTVKGPVDSAFLVSGRMENPLGGVFQRQVRLVQWLISILRVQPSLAERVCRMEKTKSAEIRV